MKKFMTKIVAVASALTMLGSMAAAADYNAYLCVQGSAYTFRNQWNDKDYGRDSQKKEVPSGWGYSTALIGWVDNTATLFAADITDATISGDGDYTVSMENITWNGDSTLNMVFVCTDIPLEDSYTDDETGVVLENIIPSYTCKFDGSEVASGAAIQKSDESNYVLFTIVNIYDDTLATFTYTMPTSITVDFTVKGLPADTATTTTDTTTTTGTTTTTTTTTDKATKTGDSTAMVALGALAVVSLAGVVVLKKRNA